MSEINTTKKFQKPNLQDKTKREALERKRSILYLILNFLQENNYNKTANCLGNEAQLSVDYDLCENIDLEIILQEYQSYYYTKFQKYPKFMRKKDNGVVKQSPSAKIQSKVANGEWREQEEFTFDITTLNISSNDDIPYDLNQIPSECREIARQIMSEFVPNTLDVNWSDCIGLTETIERLKEASLYPKLYPELFSGLEWRGILLFGPPGTGKTLLAKALACESGTKFITVQLSVFISKWRGDSEKMLKVLFDLARHYAPVTIFIDEIDAIIEDNSQHEATKRFISEFLQQMDGINGIKEHVFLLATTNSPWNINKAMLRRFEKRIFINLPTNEQQINILQYYLNKYDHNIRELKQFVEMMKYFSGCDIKNACKEAALICVREKLKQLQIKPGKSNGKVRKIEAEDLKKAFNRINPCVCDVNRFIEWNLKFGCD